MLLVLQENLATIRNAIKPPLSLPYMRLEAEILQRSDLCRHLDIMGRPVVSLDDADAKFVQGLAAEYGITLDEVEREGLELFTVTRRCPRSHPVTPEPPSGSSAAEKGDLGAEVRFECAVCKEAFAESRTSRSPGVT